MSRLIPLWGTELARIAKAASVKANEIHTTSDQKRVFLENKIVAPLWLGAVADQTAMLALHSGTYGCWPGDKCKRSDVGTIWECISNNGGLVADWVEITTDRIGTIRMWSGSTGALPTGYALCDGSGGTPDLRDKFIQGLGASTAIGNTGGNVSHSHAAGTLAVADHSTAADTAVTGAGTRVTTANHSVSGSTGSTDGRPPFYVLAFIKRVS